MERGQYVEIFWSDGIANAGTVYGKIIKAGVRTYTVRWENGICNRLQQGDPRVKLSKDQEYARSKADKDSSTPSVQTA